MGELCLHSELASRLSQRYACAAPPKSPPRSSPPPPSPSSPAATSPRCSAASTKTTRSSTTSSAPTSLETPPSNASFRSSKRPAPAQRPRHPPLRHALPLLLRRLRRPRSRLRRLRRNHLPPRRPQLLLHHPRRLRPLLLLRRLPRRRRRRRRRTTAGGARRIMQRISLTPRPNWQQTVESAGPHLPHPRNGASPTGTSPPPTSSPPPRSTPSKPPPTSSRPCASPPPSTSSTSAATPTSTIPAAAVPAIEAAWNAEPPALYGRFDVMWAGATSGHPPKLLEYNADTPTSLLEAAVIQWNWLEHQAPTLTGRTDQFNSLHERLIAKWKDVTQYLQQARLLRGRRHPGGHSSPSPTSKTPPGRQASRPAASPCSTSAGTPLANASSTSQKTRLRPSSSSTPGRPCSRRTSAPTRSRPTDR